MSRSKITLADIAREASVSTSTVSRALSDSPLISDAVKEKIKAIAKEKNYQVNLSARNLRLRKTGIVAIVIPIEATDAEILSNPFILELLGRVAYVLRQFEYNLLLLREKNITSDLLQSGIADGFIQIGHKFDPSFLNNLVSDTPFVVWGPKIDGQQYISVGVDSRAMAKLATQHLIQLGCRRIGIITGSFEIADAESHLRFAGYRDALDEAGIPYDDTLSTRTRYSPASGKKATQRLIQQAPDIDAIFVAHSDMVAMVSIEVLREAGYRVPEDVAVVGFDNIAMGEYLAISLTTISQAIQGHSTESLIETLMKQIDGESVESVTTQGKLIVRRSCGSKL